MPLGEGRSYTLFHIDGCTTAAMYEQGGEHGLVASHWASYIMVEDADAIGQSVRRLGGAVVREPFDVMDIGRMAVLTDPGGATFCVWQNYKHAGVETFDRVGGVSYNELLTTEVSACQQFYSALFGWQTEERTALGRRYVHCRADDERWVGIREVPDSLIMPVAGHWLVYIRVVAIEPQLAQIVELGGQCLVPISELPGRGRFAVVCDTDGALFALTDG